MTRTTPALLLAAAVAACGTSEDPCAAERFFVDGELVAEACGRLWSNALVGDGAVRGHLNLGYLEVEHPWFELAYESNEPPSTFTVSYDFPRRPDAPSWAVAQFGWWDDTGPLRATSGTGSLSIVDGYAVIEIAGLLARRDGKERPFTARIEGELEIECRTHCEESRKPCPPSDLALCDRIRSLAASSK